MSNVYNRFVFFFYTSLSLHYIITKTCSAIGYFQERILNLCSNSYGNFALAFFISTEMHKTLQKVRSIFEQNGHILN